MPKSEVAGCSDDDTIGFITLPEWLYHSALQSVMLSDPVSLHPFLHLVLLFFLGGGWVWFGSRHSNRCIMTSLYDFHLHFNNNRWYRTFFTCLFSMYFLFDETIVTYLPILLLDYLLFTVEFLRVLYRYLSFVVYVVHKYFSQSSIACLFILLP